MFAVALVTQPTVRAAEPALLGAWNGAHISAELTAQGGTFEFDCAHGAIEKPLVPDQRGRFDVTGRYFEERGGPVRADAPEDAGMAVRYQGTVKADRMQLTVTRSDSGVRIGAFTLVRGAEPTLVKCR